MRLCETLELLTLEENKTYKLFIGKWSITNMFPEPIFVVKGDGLLDLQWKECKWMLSSSGTIKYWRDGFTGCEYNSYDKIMVDTTNSHKLEYAYDALEELEELIDKRGLYDAK